MKQWMGIIVCMMILVSGCGDRDRKEREGDHRDSTKVQFQDNILFPVGGFEWIQK